MSTVSTAFEKAQAEDRAALVGYLPAGFPTVARLQLALTNGDNPKLICQAYFGITSNTVQFGADCSLYAAAFGFSIQGDVGYDVLIQLVPFHFVADFRASVQLKRGSHNLFKIAYTWSHTMDDSTAEVNSTVIAPRRPQDFNNIRSEWASSLLDRRQRLSATWIW